MELDLVNKYIILSEIRYGEYVKSLDGGFLIQVTQVLKKVQSSGFVENSQKESFQINYNKIDQIRSSLASFQSIINNKKQTPNPITSKPIFTDQASLVAIGNWKAGYQVSYAVQYKIENTFTRISPFSTKFTLSQGMNNPTITLPKAPQTVDERFIYRRFGNDQPEYIGSVTGFNSIDFKDVDRDLFIAAGLSNEVIGLPQVEALLRLGANASSKFDLGKTAFHVAAEQNNNKVLSLMFNEKRDLEHFDLNGKMPIHIAAEVGNVEAVETLVNLGGDINALSFYNLNSLQIASMNGQDKVIRSMLKKESIKIITDNHNTFPPLHLAVVAGHLESVNELLSYPNLDVNFKDEGNFTALHHAISLKDTAIFELLTARPTINVNLAASTGLTAMHLAAIEGKLHFVEALLKLPNANSLLKTDSGLTVLHLAAVNNHTSIVQLILRQIPSLTNEKNNDGSTALHLAVAQQNLEVIKVLLVAGKADINAVANDGMTALHVAASTYQTEVVAMLMLLGAKTNLKTNRGLTPLHYAVWYGRSAVSISFQI
jgi:ankyrin repeat protein